MVCLYYLTSGCTNQFVRVEFNTTTSTIICRFLNQTDTSVKSCAVMYGQCDQELVGSQQGKSTMEAPNYIELRVDPAGSGLDCYVVTASSEVFSVMVEARSRKEPGSAKLYDFFMQVIKILIFYAGITSDPGIVVVAIIVPIVILSLGIVVVSIVIYIIVRKKRSKGKLHPSSNIPIF